VQSVKGVFIMTAVITTRSAVLDDAHVGDIRGALGTIRAGDLAPRTTLPARLKTMLAIAGPGLIVMVGDNDAGVVAVLITLSVVLTASVLFPAITAGQIVTIMIACASLAVLAGGWAVIRRRRSPAAPVDRSGREAGRMPPLNTLSAPLLSGGRKMGLAALRAYLAIAMILVIIKVVTAALGH
jgi:hypothetical protein